MPIQMVYDRWISKYSELWAKNLSSLKHSLEKEDTAMSQQNLSHVFVKVMGSADRSPKDPAVFLRHCYRIRS
jgi:hypothetical protein